MGEETLKSDKLTLPILLRITNPKRLVEATFANGIKGIWERSVQPSKSSLKPLREYFGRMLVRSIKTCGFKPLSFVGFDNRWILIERTNIRPKYSLRGLSDDLEGCTDRFPDTFIPFAKVASTSLLDS